MEAIAELSGGIGAGRVEQLRIDEGIYQGVGRRLRNVEQCGDHPGGEVGRVEQAEAAEGAPGGLVEAVVTQRESGSYFQISEAELVEAPVLVGQIGREPGQPPRS